MNILSIDTASNLCTVSVLVDEFKIEEIIVNDARNHSEKIMPVITEALEKSNIKINDINLIVCDKGPGSFTGIRIGVGTALAFRDSLNIPCIGISSLESLAYNVSTDGLICTLIDAKNNNVYFSLFNLDKTIYTQLEDFSFNTIDEVILKLNKYDDNITFVGDGSIINKPLLKQHFLNCEFSDNNDLSSYRLGLAGFKKYSQKIDSSIMPLYLRKSQAERALEEKSKKE